MPDGVPSSAGARPYIKFGRRFVQGLRNFHAQVLRNQHATSRGIAILRPERGGILRRPRKHPTTGPKQIDIQILCKALRLHYLEHSLAICVKGCHGHFGQDWRVFAHFEYHVGHRLQATAVLMVVLEADEQILRKIFKELLLLDVLAFYDDVYLRTY